MRFVYFVMKKRDWKNLFILFILSKRQRLERWNLLNSHRHSRWINLDLDAFALSSFSIMAPSLVN